jgi:hypothetical protein
MLVSTTTTLEGLGDSSMLVSTTAYVGGRDETSGFARLA